MKGECCSPLPTAIGLLLFKRAIERTGKLKHSTNAIKAASDVHILEVSQIYKPTEPFMHCIPWLQEFLESPEIVISETITVVRYGDPRCTRLLKIIYRNIDSDLVRSRI